MTLTPVAPRMRRGLRPGLGNSGAGEPCIIDACRDGPDVAPAARRPQGRGLPMPPRSISVRDFRMIGGCPDRRSAVSFIGGRIDRIAGARYGALVMYGSVRFRIWARRPVRDGAAR